MKKQNLLKTIFITLSFILLGGGAIAQETLPYSYGFEYSSGTAAEALATEGWTLNNCDNQTGIGSIVPYGGSSKHFLFKVNTDKDYQYLISPLLSNSTLLYVSFYARVSYSTNIEYQVGYSTSETPDVTSNFHWEEAVELTSTTYALKENIIHTEGIKYIAIKFNKKEETITSHYLYIDDITISQYVTPPTNLAVSALVTSATFTWNAGSDENDWLLYYSTSNSAPSASLVTPSDNVKAVSGNPKYSLTGLTEGTTYYAWVRSGDGDGNYSSWVGPVEYTPATIRIIVLNDDTKSNSSMPFSYYVINLNRSQFIMPATELTDMVGMEITKLTFHTSTVSATWGDATFKIYMTEVENSSFASNTYYNWSDMTEVFDAGSTFSLANKQLEITLTTPYVYNGGNLMIGFYQETSGTNPSYMSWYGANNSDTSKKLSLYGSGTSTPSSSYFLPKTTFTYTYAEIYNSDGNWTTGSGAPAATDNVLVQSNITIASETNATANVIDIDAGSLTIANGATLTCNDINPAGGSVTIQDGGQLICNNSVNATLQKEITAAVIWGTPGADAWYFIASPVDGYATSNVIISGTGDTDLYSYDEENLMWYNAQVGTHSFTTLNQGQGYLYANAGANLAFIGEMPATSSNIVKDLDYASSDDKYKGFNLMGNPFTCNLTGDNVKIQDDETLTPLSTYYIVENGTEITEMNIASNPIKPGRGFLIQADGEGQKLVFNPGAKRSETTNKPSFIVIEAGNDSFMDRACVQIGSGNTLRKMTINDNVSHVYVMQDDKDYAAATIEEALGEMPVCFKAAQDGQYTITVSPQEVEMGYLHLIDNVAGKDIDLLATPSYTFNAKADDYESRFRLVFSANMVNTDLNDDFAFFSNGQLVIANEGESILQVIDVNGRIVTTESVNGTCSKAINVKAGVYVLRLIQGTDVKTQKIIVK